MINTRPRDGYPMVDEKLGIAKLVLEGAEGKDLLTNTSLMVGTLKFMSPKQAQAIQGRFRIAVHDWSAGRADRVHGAGGGRQPLSLRR